MKIQDKDDSNRKDAENRDPDEVTEEELDQVSGGQGNLLNTAQSQPAPKLTPEKVEAKGENIR